MDSRILHIFKTLAAVLICLAPVEARAATMGYSIVFEDAGGTQIGAGQVLYDSSVTEDLYARASGERCSDPAEFDCSYVDTWTPVTLFEAEIQGIDVLKYGTGTALWMEGYYVWSGVGGFTPGFWLAGDFAFGMSQFRMDTPPPGAPSHMGHFLFMSVDPPGTGTITDGNTILTQIPLPASGFLLGVSLLGVWALWRRRAAG